MADFLSTFLGVLGALGAAILGGLVLESYKRHGERQGVASAVAGEISAIIAMAEKRKHVDGFSYMVQALRQGKDIPIPDLNGGMELKMDPVIDRHLGHLGLLRTDTKLPERIVTFYTNLQGIRIDLKRLLTDEFKNALSVKADVIEEDLKLWNETVLLGKDISAELTAISQEAWWTIKLWQKSRTQIFGRQG